MAEDTPPDSGTGEEADTAADGPIRPERARRKSSLLWGLVGGLAFLVLIQGYELLADEPVTIAAKVGVALAVAVGATALTYAAHGRLSTRNESA